MMFSHGTRKAWEGKGCLQPDRLDIGRRVCQPVRTQTGISFSAEAVVRYAESGSATKDYHNIQAVYCQGVNDISKNLNTLRGLIHGFKPGNPVPH